MVWGCPPISSGPASRSGPVILSDLYILGVPNRSLAKWVDLKCTPSPSGCVGGSVLSESCRFFLPGFMISGSKTSRLIEWSYFLAVVTDDASSRCFGVSKSPIRSFPSACSVVLLLNFTNFFR